MQGDDDRWWESLERERMMPNPTFGHGVGQVKHRPPRPRTDSIEVLYEEAVANMPPWLAKRNRQRLSDAMGADPYLRLVVDEEAG